MFRTVTHRVRRAILVELLLSDRSLDFLCSKIIGDRCKIVTEAQKLAEAGYIELIDGFFRIKTFYKEDIRFLVDLDPFLCKLFTSNARRALVKEILSEVEYISQLALKSGIKKGRASTWSHHLKDQGYVKLHESQGLTYVEAKEDKVNILRRCIELT